jgi:hypothetical protein
MSINFFRGLRWAIPVGLIMWALIIWAAASIVSCAHAGDFSAETVVEESVYQALHVIDAAQTVYIAKHPDQYYEKESGLIIGRHPSESTVIKFMAADAIVHIAVTTALVKLDAPAWLTRTWELITIADTGNCVRGNFKIGIKARF